MKKRTSVLLSVISILFSFSTSFAQVTMQPITGWNMEEKNGSYIFKPVKSPDNKEFTYEVMPVTKTAGQSFDEWFNNAIDKDLQASGYVLPAPGSRKNITSNQTIFSFSSEVTDKEGQHWYITYISYQSTGSEFRLARAISSPDVKYYANCMRPAAAHFGTLATQPSSGGTVTRSTYKAPVEPSQEEEHFLLVTGDAADKALKSEDIKGVLIHLDNSYAADGSVIRIYNPYLILNDGTIYSEAVLSPYNLNVELSKLREPKKWGTWKMKGNVLFVNWPGRDQNEKWSKDWFWATPASKNERIEGVFTTRSGKDNEGLVLNDKSGATRNISLNSSGQFALLPLTDGNNGNPTVSSSDYTKKNEAGTYKLNDYSIELRFNNGSVLRRTFYFYLQGRTHFGIGNYAYVPKRTPDTGIDQ